MPKKSILTVSCSCQTCGSEMEIPKTRFDHGRARNCSLECSLKHNPDRIQAFWKKVNILSSTECWNFNGRHYPNGYGNVNIDGKNFTSHRFTWMISRGAIESGKEVCHRCDNRSCCNPDHLFIGTHKENMRDMIGKGRGRQGFNQREKRLKRSEVIQIRIMASSGHSLAEIAKHFKITISNASYIVTRKTWQNIP